MDLNAKLIQQQALKLTMTQELSQAIELLQLSTIELQAFLENKALENPLIDIKDMNNKIRRKRKQGNLPNDSNWIEKIGDQRFTLEDHILPQLQDKKLTDKQRRVIRNYIYNLDHNGYFTGNLEEISNEFHITLAEAQDLLGILQQVEPAGIGARNLQECLLLQIRRDTNFYQLAETIISDYFKILADRKWRELAKILLLDVKEIQNVFDYVLNLNPRPGASYHFERASYIVPDVLIVHNGVEYVVSLFDHALPKIDFNKQYYNHLSSGYDQKVITYIQEKKHDYEWIVRCLEQREKTIKNVMEKILEKQQEYFEKGPEYLRPMTMKEISVELGIHESTVSRTVRGKYAQTPFGTVELKSFFTNAIESLADKELSSRQVKNVLVDEINSENKFKPLSDLDLAKLLKEKEGIVVSRRTIAKYREQLGISSSSKRKRFE